MSELELQTPLTVTPNVSIQVRDRSIWDTSHLAQREVRVGLSRFKKEKEERKKKRRTKNPLGVSEKYVSGCGHKEVRVLCSGRKACGGLDRFWGGVSFGTLPLSALEARQQASSKQATLLRDTHRKEGVSV